jgi:hypothetical protein
LLFFLLISKVSSFLVFLRKFWERETEACLVPQNPPLSKKKKKISWLALSLSLSSMVLLRRERRMTVGFEIKKVGLKI